MINAAKQRNQILSLLDLDPIPVTLGNGTVLNYVRAGAGPTLIFIHGAMGDYRAWAPQWDAFTSSYDCISYSRRYSHPNPNELRTRDHSALVDAEDLLLLMDALGLEQAILVGSSYGGFTALATAVAAPDRVRALVSVEAPMMPYAEASEEGAAIVREFKENTQLPARRAFELGHNQEGTRILTGGIVGKKPSDVPAEVLMRRMQNVRAARSLSLSDNEFPLIEKEKISALKMPMLLMSGANTAPIHAAIFKAVCAALPQARSVIVPESGHSVSQQQAGIFNTEVKAFLSANLAQEPA